MIKIITACGIKHEQYMESCLESTKGLDAEHIFEISDALTKGITINRLLKQVNDNDIVALLDADDMARPDWFDSIEELNHYDLIYGGIRQLNQDGSYKDHYPKPFSTDLMFKINNVPGSGTILKGWLAKSEPYPLRTDGADDWVWWHRLMRHSTNWAYIPQIFITYRTWTSYNNNRCYIPVYSKLKRLLRRHNTLKDIRHEKSIA